MEYKLVGLADTGRELQGTVWGAWLCSLRAPYAMSSEFLSELHWEDGFAIPVANQENKILEDQVRRTRWDLGER